MLVASVHGGDEWLDLARLDVPHKVRHHRLGPHRTPEQGQVLQVPTRCSMPHHAYDVAASSRHTRFVARCWHGSRRTSCGDRAGRSARRSRRWSRTCARTSASSRAHAAFALGACVSRAGGGAAGASGASVCSTRLPAAEKAPPAQVLRQHCMTHTHDCGVAWCTFRRA